MFASLGDPPVLDQARVLAQRLEHRKQLLLLGKGDDHVVLHTDDQRLGVNAIDSARKRREMAAQIHQIGTQTGQRKNQTNSVFQHIHMYLFTLIIKNNWRRNFWQTETILFDKIANFNVSLLNLLFFVNIFPLQTIKYQKIETNKKKKHQFF